jgi:hypothetical protein
MQTPNFGFILPQPGDMVFGKLLNDIMADIDQKLFNALYGDHTAFYGLSLAVADPGVGITAPIILTPLPEVVFAHEVTLKKLRVIIPAGTNTVAGPGLQLNIARVSDGIAILTTPVDVPSAAGLDTVVDVPAGEDLADDDELQLTVTNSTLAPIAGTFDVEIVLAADIKFAAE